MKRICFLVDSVFSIGGVQRVTAVIAKALASHYHVTIVTLDAPSHHDTSLYDLSQSPIAFRHFAYPRVSRLTTLLCRAYSAVYRKLLYRLPPPFALFFSDLYAHSSFPAKLRRALQDELLSGHYDTIVGVHAPLAVRLATIRKSLPGVRLIGWIHNSFEALYGSTSLYIGPDRQRHYVYQLRRLHATVVLSLADAQAYTGYDPAFHPVVIHNPLTLTPGPRSQGVSHQFLAVGRFSRRHKGFDLLIEAFHLFAARDSQWTLHIVGEGSEEPLYRQLIQRYGLQERVLLHPFTSDIQAYYSQAQVYVLSSRWEGFGLVLVEAMAHGLPVVSSDLPTSLEIMGPAGIYFENGNVEQLAQRLYESTHMNWRQKSDECYAMATHFAVDDIVAQWRNIIDAL